MVALLEIGMLSNDGKKKSSQKLYQIDGMEEDQFGGRIAGN